MSKTATIKVIFIDVPTEIIDAYLMIPQSDQFRELMEDHCRTFNMQCNQSFIEGATAGFQFALFMLLREK